MKNRILTFLIGILTGAIITTIGFMIINKSMINDNEFNKIPLNGEIQGPNPNMGEPPEIRNEDFQNK